jgi:molecular chaperone HtpG
MEKFEFKAETKQLLDLMIHSIYSNKEIFLRELVSNASDALDKLKFESLTNSSFEEHTKDLHIRLTGVRVPGDSKERTLTISDNGIGMSRDEVIEYIGTIAKSGSREFLSLLEQNKGEIPPELIGQFGVGLYSSFMVADKVEVKTRRAGEDKGTHWISSGDGTYELEEIEKDGYGTDIILHLKHVDNDDGIRDYTKEWVLKELIKTYSDYVGYPVKMEVEHTEFETPENKEDPPIEKKTITDETLNSMKAIWRRDDEEISDDDYNEFYKHISHDWNEPLKHVSLKAEGTVEFKGLLYIPKKATQDMFVQPDGESKSGIQLYIKRVFIMHDCKDLIPQYLRFLRGVVDSEDLTLNISREMLQQNRMIRVIRNRLTGKVLDTLLDMKEQENEKFLEFWKEFGPVFKEGIIQDSKHKERVLDICVFDSTHSKEEKISLTDYVGRMVKDQKVIYYMTGASREGIENSPHLETFKKKGYEVLLLSEAIDEIWAEQFFEYKDLRFKNIGKGNVELGTDEERKEEKEKLEEQQKEHESLLKFMQGKLDDDIKEVRLSSRLTESPVCLVGEQQDITPQMEDILRKMGKDIPKIKRILEINPSHAILGKLQDIYDKDSSDERVVDYAHLLYGQALLAEGTMPKDPGTLSKAIASLMLKAL